MGQFTSINTTRVYPSDVIFSSPVIERCALRNPDPRTRVRQDRPGSYCMHVLICGQQITPLSTWIPRHGDEVDKVRNGTDVFAWRWRNNWRIGCAIFADSHTPEILSSISRRFFCTNLIYNTCSWIIDQFLKRNFILCIRVIHFVVTK